jgi:integrase
VSEKVEKKARRARGDGQLIQRSKDVWSLRYVDKAGHRTQTTVRGSKSSAAAELRRLLGQDQAPDPAEAKRTFGDLLDEWLAFGRDKQGRPWAPRTVAENRRQVDARIKPELGKILLTDLRPRDLEAVYERWAKDKLSDSSVHKLAALIGSALNLAVRRDYIDHSPTVRAVAPAQPKSNKLPPSRDEVVELLRAAQAFGHDMPAAIALAALTGARQGEIAALRWGDIDLKRGAVRVEQQAIYVNRQVMIGPTKNDAMPITFLSQHDLAVLKEMIGQPGPSDRYVIDGGTDPVKPGTVGDRFTKVRTLAGVRDSVTFHGLRSYWATSMLAAGIPVHDVAADRWASVRMVHEVYGHARHDAAKRMAEVDLLPTLTA